jgi:hypothetical protein
MEAVVGILPGPIPPVMDTILTWIGFDQETTRDRIRDEGFGTFADLMSTKAKDISSLAESYGRRTVADGRVIFGLRRIRHLIGLIHWVHDFRRIGEEPSIEGFDNAAQFRQALEEAFDRADVRKIEGDQSDTLSKAADPGKLKDERKWTEWEPAFVNYLSTIPGVTGVPLSYVIREHETPTPGEDYGSFNERCISCAPLVGNVFQADARKVHQLVKSFLQAETAEQWVRPHLKAQNGRLDMKALRDHYTGEGNTSRRIAVAERLRDSLHYKNEKSMQFSSFLAKMQTMFNIFEEEKEIMSEQAKVRILLKKVEHPELRSAVNALRIRATMDGMTFTECANHLSGMVAELPDYQSARKVSATDSKHVATKRIRGGGADKQKGDPGSKRKGINMPDGSIWTGYYSDWDKMSDSDKQTVMDTRKKNKAKGLTPGKKSGGSNDLKAQFAAMKRTLAAMQSKKSTKDADSNDSDDSDVAENAGDAFGGRRSKKQKKE